MFSVAAVMASVKTQCCGASGEQDQPLGKTSSTYFGDGLIAALAFLAGEAREGVRVA